MSFQQISKVPKSQNCTLTTLKVSLPNNAALALALAQHPCDHELVTFLPNSSAAVPVNGLFPNRLMLPFEFFIKRKKYPNP